MPAAEADVERDEEVAGFVPRRAEREFVVIARYAPFVGDGDVLIGHAIAVVVNELREFGALHHVHVVIVFDPHTEGLMQARREAGEADLAWDVRGGIMHEPDFATPGTGEEFAIGSQCEAADFEHAIGRRLERRHLVKSRLIRCTGRLSVR